MTLSFVAQELSSSAVPQALPLLRATWPKVDLGAWEGLTDSHHHTRSSGSSMTGLYDSHGGLCGLFLSRIEPDIEGAQILTIPIFTVIDIANSLIPVRALLDAAVAKAKAEGCHGLRIHLGKEQTALSRRMRRLGLERGDNLFLSTSNPSTPLC